MRAASDDFDRHIHDVRARASGRDPLALLAQAAATRDELTATAEGLLDHFIELARDSGCSWPQIGQALGVSKQAAQQRATAPARLLRQLLGRFRDPGMLRRLDDATRDCIVSARQIATELGHHHVGTQHLLLGILAVPGTPAEASLAAAGATRHAVQSAVARHVNPEAQTSERAPLTPRAKTVIDLSLRESLSDRSNRIRPEHLLRGLLRERSGIGAQVLVELGTDLDDLRADLAHRLDPEP